MGKTRRLCRRQSATCIRGEGGGQREREELFQGGTEYTRRTAPFEAERQKKTPHPLTPSPISHCDPLDKDMIHELPEKEAQCRRRGLHDVGKDESVEMR